MNSVNFIILMYQYLPRNNLLEQIKTPTLTGANSHIELDSAFIHNRKYCSATLPDVNSFPLSYQLIDQKLENTKECLNNSMEVTAEDLFRTSFKSKWIYLIILALLIAVFGGWRVFSFKANHQA